MSGVTAAGLWGLIGINGAPVDPHDAARLGLAIAATDRLVEGRDSQDPGLVDQVRDRAGHTVLTGWIAGAAVLAERLGLPRGTAPAALARAAIERFGGDTPNEMLGEWSLYHAPAGGPQWLIQSAAQRDRLFFAANGSRLAFAPDLIALGSLDWVGRRIDPEAFALHLGNAHLRSQLGWRSMLSSVERIPAGASLRIDADGTLHRHFCLTLTEQPRFPGNQEEALEALESTLRSITRERLGMAGRPAILLSGGLDSSLLAAIAATELADPPLAICSVAPAGSGLDDEFSFATAVAEQHGIELVPACPGADGDPFRAPDHVMAGANGPLISNRHLLTSQFQQIGRELGATMLVNGTYGEMSLSTPLPGRPSLRSRLGAMRRAMVSALAPQNHAFHVQLAPEMLAQNAVRTAQPATVTARVRKGAEPIGFISGSDKALAQPNAYFPGALRMDFPFRDLRLLRLYASLPREIAYGLGADRGPARSIGAGILPRPVLARRLGMPADPGHMARLQAFAPTARERIAVFRTAQVDEWLDLDWLDQALARIAIKGPATVDEANRVQLSALTAEYLNWLNGGSA